jgi:hypothetical protein
VIDAHAGVHDFGPGRLAGEVGGGGDVDGGRVEVAELLDATLSHVFEDAPAVLQGEVREAAQAPAEDEGDDGALDDEQPLVEGLALRAALVAEVVVDHLDELRHLDAEFLADDGLGQCEEDVGGLLVQVLQLRLVYLNQLLRVDEEVEERH